MQLTITIPHSGSYKIRCRECNQTMRLVGIEPHPNIPDMVDLVTYECRCGAIIAEPHLPEILVRSGAPH